jgi:hypothetical protein
MGGNVSADGEVLGAAERSRHSPLWAHMSRFALAVNYIADSIFQHLSVADVKRMLHLGSDRSFLIPYVAILISGGALQPARFCLRPMKSSDVFVYRLPTFVTVGLMEFHTRRM